MSYYYYYTYLFLGVILCVKLDALQKEGFCVNIFVKSDSEHYIVAAVQ